MTTPETKITVDWSYPSSPNAVRFGCSKTGCYTVSRTDRKRDGSPKPPKAIAGFNTRGEAEAYAHLYARDVCCVMACRDIATV